MKEKKKKRRISFLLFVKKQHLILINYPNNSIQTLYPHFQGGNNSQTSGKKRKAESNRRVDSEGTTTERATRLSRQPLIHALGVEPMLALRQHFHLLAVVEYSEADAALAVGEILLVVGNRDLVQNDGEAVDGGSIEPLPPPQRRVG